LKTNIKGEKIVHMDRAIFNLGTSVEATSLYILLCALLDQGESLTLDRAGVQWNGTREELKKAAEELAERGVLSASKPLTQDQPLQLNSPGEWQ
jgi:hypothetical protein